MKKGKVQFVIEKEDICRINLGVPGWKKGDPIMAYHIEFEAEGFENINMEHGKTFKEAKYPEWPPTRIDKNKYALEGVVLGFPWDSFKVIKPKYVLVKLIDKVEGLNTVSSFDAYLNNDLVVSNAKCVRFFKPNYMIEGAIGGAIGGAILGNFVKSDAFMIGVGAVTGAVTGAITGSMIGKPYTIARLKC